MSFFGLTFLGTQEPFVGTVPLYAFDDTELVAAAEAISKGDGGAVDMANIEAFLALVYRCPREVSPPQDIVNQVRAWFPQGVLPLSQFTTGILALKAHAEATETQNQTDTWSKGCEFTSGLDLRAAKVKHTRMIKDPNEKYTAPLTDSQTFGWVKGPPVKTFPKKSCEETKFASAMIQSGVNYF
ncbi:hypothetical protein H310_12967 [Aphanomyces invadans]|uniref:Uncharacterized protein n=1 Tax=Aphanomyces invadans TaxID=157072 RepID=A0A024TI24_9STRA|nr:hypothetical protein H310_12967 [Aphanomyces invadans]ETV92972.1 hypothetical protein H310_12967 [Aphanomyces invadans]|eukprot:XP_008878493.1 hypothetical protein H310_12967 [Aphanomyces invadans]